MKLNQIFKTRVYPKAPYNFKYSIQNPSHFPAPTGKNTDNVMWFTMLWENQPIGVRFVNKGSVNKPIVEITIYANKSIDEKAMVKELAYRFEWYEDYSDFYKLAIRDSKLTAILKNFRGMRMFCAENLYDCLMIAILLQNVNVKRTTQMTKAMLGTYGDLLEFDGQKLYCFWTPKRILKVWEAKIYSKILGTKTTNSKQIFSEIKKRYGEWRAVAVHYLFMDLNWRHKEKPIEWFGKIMPY